MPPENDDTASQADPNSISFAPPDPEGAGQPGSDAKTTMNQAEPLISLRGGIPIPPGSRPGESNDPPDPFNVNLIGTIVAGHFQILSKIGEGGMSIVYKAKHQLMQKEVAIKMLHPHMVGSKQSRDRFRQEAQAVSQIDHPNVVRIIDFGITETNRPYIVMDLLMGASLADTIKTEGPLEVDRAVLLFVQICDALSYAHGKGVVHRDLKPSNVILVPTESGGDDVQERHSEQSKIVDFGIAKLMPHEGVDSAALTQTGDVFGSPLYMSPEQCKGEKLDGRSDIYSMGCLMYETLTGKPPINGQNMLEILYRHMNEMPQSMKVACHENRVPQRLEAIIFKALAKEPDDRQQSMRLLKEELKQFSVSNDGALSLIRSGWSLYRSKRKRMGVRDKIAAIVTTLAIFSMLTCSVGLAFLYSYGQDKGKEAQPIDWFIQFATRAEIPAVVDMSMRNTGALLDKARSRLQKIRHHSTDAVLSPIDELDDPNCDLQQILKAGESAYRSCHFHSAAEIYEIALEISRDENGQEAVTTEEAALALSRCYYYGGDYARALRQLEQALAVYKVDLAANYNKRMRATLLSCLGDCYYRTGNYDVARRHLYDAVECWREIGPNESNSEDHEVQELKALCLSRFGDVFMQLKMYDSALKYYLQAQEAWKIPNNERERDYNLALVKYKKSLAEFAMRRYKEADTDFENAISDLKKRPTDELFHETVVSMYQQTAMEQKQSDRFFASVGTTIQAGLSKYFHEHK